MQWWLYKGAVTTPIDIPGKGPTVIRPRDKFQAPFAAVANLKRLGRVVPCRPPKEVKEPAPEPKRATEPPKAVEERAVAPPTVVASKSEPKAEVVEREKVEATVTEVADDTPKEKETQEKEAPKEKEKDKRRRRNKS